MCSSHLQLFCKITPKCLWCVVSFRIVLPKMSCWFFASPRVKFSCSVFPSLNLTVHFLAHSLIFSKSQFSVSVRKSGSFSAKDKLVSSANDVITDSVLPTMPLILRNVKKQKWTRHRTLWNACEYSLQVRLLPFDYSSLYAARQIFTKPVWWLSCDANGFKFRKQAFVPHAIECFRYVEINSLCSYFCVKRCA